MTSLEHYNLQLIWKHQIAFYVPGNTGTYMHALWFNSMILKKKGFLLDSVNDLT